MIFGVLTTCHTQYTWDRSICIFLVNRTTLQVFVTYLTGALYVHPLWFYKHQHDNQVRSTQNAFSLPFAAILVNCAPSGEMHNYCTPHIINENFENFLIYRCNYILLSQVYCAWQVVKTPTIIFNKPVFRVSYFCSLKLCSVSLRALPCLRQWVAGPSWRRLGFKIRALHVEFVVGRVALGHSFLRELPFFCCQYHFTNAPFSLINP